MTATAPDVVPLYGLTEDHLAFRDVIHGICTSMYDEFRRDEYSSPPLLLRMVSAGRLGRKTGHGFYDYAPVRAGAFA